MAKWHNYEEQIFTYIRGIFPEETKVLRGQRLTGRYSKTKRQVDVLVLTSYAERKLAVVVECKCFSTKICVPRVDAFAGFLDDANVDLGIMITTKGFSKSALNRAEATRKIILQIIDFEKGFQRMPFFERACCPICNVNRTDCPLMPIEWHWPTLSFINNDGNPRTMLLGHCSSCYRLYVDCGRCAEIIKIEECDLDKPMNCPNCGVQFRVVSKRGLPKLVRSG